jgi:hypothetical protein
MTQTPKVLHGFAWFSYPDFFGLEEDAPADPGHPFGSPSDGKIKVPEEVLYYRAANPADTGVQNEPRTHSYLVLSRTQHHPRLANGWESEPAKLTDKFKTQDGKVKLVKIVQLHKRHSGDLIECEWKLEGE